MILFVVISAMAGAVSHGTQYQMTLAYEHKLQRTAFNFCYGPFGQVKGIRRCILGFQIHLKGFYLLF